MSRLHARCQRQRSREEMTRRFRQQALCYNMPQLWWLNKLPSSFMESGEQEGGGGEGVSKKGTPSSQKTVTFYAHHANSFKIHFSHYLAVAFACLFKQILHKSADYLFTNSIQCNYLQVSKEDNRVTVLQIQQRCNSCCTLRRTIMKSAGSGLTDSSLQTMLSSTPTSTQVAGSGFDISLQTMQTLFPSWNIRYLTINTAPRSLDSPLSTKEHDNTFNTLYNT